MEPSPTTTLASTIAEAMPLVHFPAGQLFRAWSQWPALMSRVARGEAVESSCNFAVLRASHVYFYAGPTCFFKRDCIGDAVMYLAPGIDIAAPGGASPFDSGSLEPGSPCLQPWARRSVAERWAFLIEHSSKLGDWRARFAAWLATCYNNPTRYLETTADRHASGLPDRTEPEELLAHNGPAGCAQYGVKDCGDRRAWTWEVRLQADVEWQSHLAVLHIAPDGQERADALIDSLRDRHVMARVVLLPDAEVPTFEALYLRSGAILKEIVGCP